MKKKERVVSNIEFNNIIERGKKVSNKFFTIFYMETNEKFSRFGVTASKKNNNAVTRNKLKRQTRELIFLNKNLFKITGNYIIIIKRACLEYPYNDKLNAFRKLIGEIK